MLKIRAISTFLFPRLQKKRLKLDIFKHDLEKIVKLVVWLSKLDNDVLETIKYRLQNFNFPQSEYDRIWWHFSNTLNNIPEWAKECIKIYLEIE